MLGWTNDVSTLLQFAGENPPPLLPIEWNKLAVRMPLAILTSYIPRARARTCGYGYVSRTYPACFATAELNWPLELCHRHTVGCLSLYHRH